MTVRILVGDALSKLAELPDCSVHMCVTSPPYWGLRAYHGGPGMIGLEPTFEEHLENLVAVFREVRRVLRDDGTCFVNYGDAYVARQGNGLSPRSEAMRSKTAAWAGDDKMEQVFAGLDNLPPKNLMMMPARVAMALQADGWILRSMIPLIKSNPMPESVTDRPTNAVEYFFMFAKKPKYFWDAVAVRTPSNGWHGKAKPTHAPEDAGRQSDAPRTEEASANMRNYLIVATEPFKGAHFATFGTRWIEPFIKAGTSEHGCCAECGAPWRRTTEKKASGKVRIRNRTEVGRTETEGGFPQETAIVTTGWEPACDCPGPPPVVPCTVLDPFAGAGTTGLVAARLQCDAVLIEISEEYADMARKRIYDDAPLLAGAAT